MIKVFIGTEPKTEIARKVLEYSILKNTTLLDNAFEFIPMLGDNWKKLHKTKYGTGFSLFRWRIPEMCNYEGAAIYLDADILCLGDIKELYTADVNFPNNKASTWCTYGRSSKIKRDEDTPETSVMLIDCAKAKTQQPPYKACADYVNNCSTRENYFKIMRALKHKPLPQRLPERFNALNTLVDNTLFLHYTKEPEQPWYDPGHLHADLWEDYLKQAINNGAVTKEEIKAALNQWEPPTKTTRAQGMHPYWETVL